MRDTDVIVHLQRVESLLRERRYELALTLTEILEEILAGLPDAESAVERSVRDLLQASRLMTETLIRLRELRVH